MKYQAINIEYYKAIKEYEQIVKDTNLFILGFKFAVWISIIIIIIIIFKSGNWKWF